MFIAFRLKPGRDDDLISWINSLGQDERSYNIRQALRGNISPVSQPVRIQPKVTPNQTGEKLKDTGDLEANLNNWL